MRHVVKATMKRCADLRDVDVACKANLNPATKKQQSRRTALPVAARSSQDADRAARNPEKYLDAYLSSVTD